MVKTPFFSKILWAVLIINAILSTTIFAQELTPEEKVDPLHKKAIFYAREGDFPQALDLIKKVLQKNPHNLKVTFDYIVILSWSGQYEEAIQIYETLPQDIKFPDYLIIELARAYRIIGEYGKAVDLYKKYLEGNKQDPEATKGLIYTYLDARQFDAVHLYLEEHIAKDEKNKTWLSLYLADVFLREKKIDQAELIYKEILNKESNNLQARLGMARISISKKKYKEASGHIENVLKNDLRNIDALFCKGELLEAQAEFIQAHNLYEKILRMYPYSQMARNFKYRALMDLGANSLVREKLEKSREQIDIDFLQMLSGNEAMERVRWQEPDMAIDLLDKNISTNYPKKFILRSLSDKILALRQKENMPQLLKEYKNLENLNAEFAPWVLEATSDAYLYLEKPQKALSLYKNILEKKNDASKTNTKMAIYYSLVELGRYQEAKETLKALDKELPVQIVNRGVLEDNWKKAEIAYNQEGWWFLYQDRLREAQRHLEKLIYHAPFNTNIRTALAHVYLWRGWPRLALQEFEIACSLDPKDIMSKVGYCYALNENNQTKKARSLAKQLLKEYPNNKNVQKLNRYFKIQNMRTLKANSLSTDEHSGAKEIFWSNTVEQPIGPWRKIFTGFLWRKTRNDETKDNVRRDFLGIDWRINRDWWFVGSISLDEKKGKNFGYSGQMKFDPNDYLSFSLFYDSYSLSMPLRARGEGIKTKEGSFSARLRQSESFIIDTKTTFFDRSDRNDQWDYSFKLDRALTNRAYWKTRIALEGYATTNSKTEVSYFSPEHLYSIYAVPMLEHVWYRRYEKALVDRFYFGIGRQWEKSFDSKEVWFLRYEQDYRLSDLLSFLVGATFSRKNYDGENSDVWNINFSLKAHF